MARRWLRVGALGVGQLLGWGFTFYLPVILAEPLQRDLRLSEGAVFGGVTVMLLVSALLATPTGVWLARFGARRVMSIGTLILAVGAAVLGLSQSIVGYMVAWVLFGIAAPMALSQAATTAVQQWFAENSRRAIGALTIVTSLTPALIWPTLSALEPIAGWRNCCFGIAVLFVLMALPLNVYGAPGRVSSGSNEAQRHERFEGWSAGVLLLALSFAVTSLITWGLALHIFTAARALGHSADVAIAAGALAGPVQILGRVLDTALATRTTLPAAGLASILLMFSGLLIAAVAGESSIGLYGFVILYAIGAGVLTIVRSALPAELFGDKFAVMYGRLAAFHTLAFALGPFVAAVLISRLGPAGAFWVFSVATLVAVLMFSASTRLLSNKRARTGSHCATNMH